MLACIFVRLSALGEGTEATRGGGQRSELVLHAADATQIAAAIDVLPTVAEADGIRDKPACNDVIAETYCEAFTDPKTADLGVEAMRAWATASRATTPST